MAEKGKLMPALSKSLAAKISSRTNSSTTSLKSDIAAATCPPIVLEKKPLPVVAVRKRRASNHSCNCLRQLQKLEQQQKLERQQHKRQSWLSRQQHLLHSIKGPPMLTKATAKMLCSVTQT